MHALLTDRRCLVNDGIEWANSPGAVINILFVLNSWTCERILRDSTTGKYLLKQLVKSEFCNCVNVVCCWCNNLSFHLYWPQISSWAKRQQRPFSAQEIRMTGRLHDRHGHCFPLSRNWYSKWSVMPPWPWDLRARDIWSGCDSWNCCTLLYPQKKDNIWHRGKPSRKMEGIWVLDGIESTWFMRGS